MSGVGESKPMDVPSSSSSHLSSSSSSSSHKNPRRASSANEPLGFTSSSTSGLSTSGLGSSPPSLSSTPLESLPSSVPSSASSSLSGSLTSSSVASKQAPSNTNKAQKTPFQKPIEPKPKLSKAERRELQEKQRAAKRDKLISEGKLPPNAQSGPGSSSHSSSTPSTTTTTPSSTPSTQKATKEVVHKKEAPSTATKSVGSSGSKQMQFDDAKRRAKATKKKILPHKLAQKSVALFAHLPQYEKQRSISASSAIGFDRSEIPSAILHLGLKYADGVITGSNARCVSMLTAFKQVIQDYVTPVQKSLHRDLEVRIKPMIQFLVDCRPLSISMGNAINYLKLQISYTSQMSESEAKEFLLEKIDSFINERIVLADKLISGFAVTKINDRDVILTHGGSYVIEQTLKRAHDEGKRFRVIIVDSRPQKEGKKLLEKLVKHGLECTYVLINAISYIMKEVSKVFLGAFTCLSNGNVLSRVGSAVVAMMAHAHNVPVIICCETYKFCERVQLDSICFNELADPDELVIANRDGAKLTGWRENENLKLLNLVYDLTPVEFVNLVITEVGMIPPTSVPVVLREYRKDMPAV